MRDVILDLFGQPVRERRDGRGRPEHVRTPENSNKVNLLFACGHEIKDVAAALGVSVPTLRKHYFSECEGRRVAKLRLTGLQLERLNAEAAKGNVTAEKALLGMVEREQVKATAGKVLDRGKGRSEPKAPALGKKDQAAEDAKKMGGRFGTRQPPPGLTH